MNSYIVKIIINKDKNLIYLQMKYEISVFIV